MSGWMSIAPLLIQSLSRLLGLYQLILIVYILSSWLPPLRASAVGQILAQVSEPYLGLFRGLVPFLVLDGIDFSPILAFVILNLVRRILDQVYWSFQAG